MKKYLLGTGFYFLFLTSFIFVYSCQDKVISAERLISQCAEALGGSKNIEKVKTLRIASVFPDHGPKALAIEIKRPNLSYNPESGITFDGKRAGWVKGKDGRSETEFVDAEEWKDFEVEIGVWFPAFFDYKAEYLGMESVKGKQNHILSVRLPLGAILNYYIDAETFFPVKTVAHLVVRGEKRTWKRDYWDYKEVEGILFPHGFSYESRNGTMKGWVDSIEINIPMTNDRFVIPVDYK